MKTFGLQLEYLTFPWHGKRGVIHSLLCLNGDHTKAVFGPRAIFIHIKLEKTTTHISNCALIQAQPLDTLTVHVI